MSKIIFWVASITIALLIAPVCALADDNHPPQWWQVASGVLAIPAALLGIIYSYFLLKKTRLESRKTELEIREKEGQLRNIAAGDPELAQRLLEPVVNARLGQLLILRFIILYLTLKAWTLLETLVTLSIKGAAIGLVTLLGEGEGFELEKWFLLPFLVLTNLPEAGYWLIFFLLGWPLFKDVNGVLGLDLRDFLRLRRAPRREVNRDDAA